MVENLMVENYGKRPEAIYIECNKNIFVEVDKKAFFASEYIRNIVGTITETIQPRTSYEELEDKDAWIAISNLVKELRKSGE